MTNLAPIALFVYNRPEHTQLTLNSLANNLLAEKSILHVFSDGVKKGASQNDIEKTEKVRDIIKHFSWPGQKLIYQSESNKGLANSIISGVTEVLNRYDKIIVVEDDLYLSTGFLKYMNDTLELYKDEDKVMHISAYMYPIKKKIPQTFFYNVSSCWGWGTWKRAWNYFVDDSDYLYEKVKLLGKKNMFYYNGGQANAFINQLEANKKGLLNTWAVKWHTSIYLNSGYCLHPGRSLVNNVGHDGTGINSKKSDFYRNKNLAEAIQVRKIPIIELKIMYIYMHCYFVRRKLYNRIYRKSRKILSKIKFARKTLLTCW